MTEAVRTLIGAIGYFNLTDLSVGPILAELLRDECWPEGVEAVDLSYGGPIAAVHRLMEASPPYGRLVLAGAADRGERRPTVRAYRWDGRLPPLEEVQRKVGESVTGIIDLDAYPVVLAQFNALPAEVYLVEIQPLVVAAGLTLSPMVSAALPGLRRLVRAIAVDEAARAACPVSGIGGALVA